MVIGGDGQRILVHWCSRVDSSPREVKEGEETRVVSTMGGMERRGASVGRWRGWMVAVLEAKGTDGHGV
jgi:hypothetical protein